MGTSLTGDYIRLLCSRSSLFWDRNDSFPMVRRVMGPDCSESGNKEATWQPSYQSLIYLVLTRARDCKFSRLRIHLQQLMPHLGTKIFGPLMASPMATRESFAAAILATFVLLLSVPYTVHSPSKKRQRLRQRVEFCSSCAAISF